MHETEASAINCAMCSKSLIDENWKIAERKIATLENIQKTQNTKLIKTFQSINNDLW